MQGLNRTVTVFAMALAILITLAINASAFPLSVGQPWGQFAFDGIGDTSVCVICTPSDGGNSFFLGDSPWTFTGSGFLIVQDAFLAGDQFEIFDDVTSLGTTSIPGVVGCGSDPVICFADPDSSRGIFPFGSGDHSFRITVIAAPFGPGTAFLCIDSGQGECGVPLNGEHEVPEPSSMLLLAVGFLGAFVWVKRPRLREILLLIPLIRRKR